MAEISKRDALRTLKIAIHVALVSDAALGFMKPEAIHRIGQKIIDEMTGSGVQWAWIAMADEFKKEGADGA